MTNRFKATLIVFNLLVGTFVLVVWLWVAPARGWFDWAVVAVWLLVMVVAAALGAGLLYDYLSSRRR